MERVNRWPVCLLLVGLVVSTVPAKTFQESDAPAAVELETAAGFRPLAFSLVPTLTPNVRITLSAPPGKTIEVRVGDLGSGIHPTDITTNFPGLLETGKGEGMISVGVGNNRLTIVVDGRAVASATMLNFGGDTVAIHPEIDSADVERYDNVEIQRTTLLLIFEPDATEVAISDFLRTERLLPIGILIDRTLPSNPKIVIVDITQNQRGLDAAALALSLNSSPPMAPLRSAVPNILMSLHGVSAEELPDRLLRGAPPNEGEGYGTHPDLRGGFDVSHPFFGGPWVDELDLSWPHFLMETFAAHRLRLKVVPPNTRAPTLAVVDTGFGNGGVDDLANPVLNDIPLGRLGGVHPRTNMRFEGIDLVRIFRVESNLRAVLSNIDDLTDVLAGGHGTAMALFAAGGGATILGTGKDVNVLPVRVPGVPMAMGRDPAALSSALAFGLMAAATVTQPQVDVVNFSMSVSDGMIRNFLAALGIPPALRAALAASYRGNYVSLFMPALNRLRFNNIIFVNSAGNENSNTNLSVPQILAPKRGQRGTRVFDGAGNRLDYPLFMVVSATGLAHLFKGPETATGFSNFGSNVSVSALGERLVGLDRDGHVRSVTGTSAAAAFVSGLAAELIQIDEALRRAPAAAAKRLRRRRIVEAIEGSADDLGTTAIAAPRPNNDPGNGPDDRFGYGRINAWKATLTVVNDGMPADGRPDADGDGRDDTFRSLKLIAEPNTRWYGFKIRTPVLGATAWLDGVQLQDQGAPVPNSPLVTAYAGVNPNYEPAVPGAVIPAGNYRGEYLMTFSIERPDLFDAQGQPRTLSLRGPGATAADAPFSNLRLELDKMRAGHVPGVRFHAFVFDITLTDFGDAPDFGPIGFPTLLVRSNGARHLNANLEWFGGRRRRAAIRVTPETNAASEPGLTAPDSSVDQDGVPNFIGRSDLDRFDDGVIFYPLTYRPDQPGMVDFNICVGVSNIDGRYSSAPDRSLYVNAWIDWNTNSIWEEVNGEHIIDGLQIDPSRGFAIVRQGVAGSQTRVTRLFEDWPCAGFRAQFPVGSIGTDQLWARFRLDHGEDVGRNDPRPHFRSDPSLRDPGLPEGTPQAAGAGIGYTQGAARFGEVEDYVIGSDFGDAPDPFGANPPGHYPTLLRNQGAYHLDFSKEWLGVDALPIPSATRETDANDAPGGVDQDPVPNLADQDRLDDGVQFLDPITHGQQVRMYAKVTSTISTRGFENAATPLASQGKGRYDARDAAKRLYLNAWADWNGNGVWEAGEKIVSAAIDPETFGGDNAYTLGESFTDTNHNGVRDGNEPFTDTAGVDTCPPRLCTFTIQVPNQIAPAFYFRFRLDYGENGTTVALEANSDDVNRLYVDDKGGALFGEVEDYSNQVPIVPLTPPEEPYATPPGQTPPSPEPGD